MSAYVWSRELPFVLYFEDLDPLTVREAVRKWMKESVVIHLDPQGIEDFTDERTEELEGTVVNFGAVAYAWVRATKPEGVPVLRLVNTDLEDL